jgi:leucyl-tRNA synthetase
MHDEGATPAHRYTAALAGDIEARWQDRWERDGTFHTPNPLGLPAGPNNAPNGAAKRGAEKLYVLDFFPYPSDVGLHVGHPLGYIGTDTYARFQRMTGRNVLHTMGFDAFGLPAEQYAIQTGTHPRVTTEANIARYRGQLRRIGMAHDPRRSVVTSDPSYYRWTQWIFLQLFNSWYDRTPTARGRSTR